MPKAKGKVRSSKLGGRAGTVDKGKKKAEKGDAVAVTPQQLDLMALLEQFDAPQHKAVGGNQLPHEENRAGYRNSELGREMARHAVGPMPIEEFIDLIPECSQRPDKMMPDSRRAFSKVPKRGDTYFKNERSLYDPVNQAFNVTRKIPQGKMARCPGVTFYNTSDQPGPGKHSTKVGASGYAQEHLKFVHDPENPASIVSHPGYWQLFWEAKIIDFAGDNGILFEHITDEKTKEHTIAGFGQTSFYAAQMCANQYRDFAFSISLTDETARLLRWDRSGVIFSEAIRYRENPEPLCRFLWRFGNANPLQRGADISVHKRITEAEEALFRDTVKAHVKLQLGLTNEKEVDKEMEKHYEPGQVCMVEVVIHQDSEEQLLASSSEYRTRGQTQAQAATRKFLVSRPVVSPRSLTSRSTRGYWSVDIQTKNIVFLKDCWRADVEAVDTEGLTLQNLRASGVEIGVPTVVCHGNVYVEGKVSSTLTSKYSENEWNKASKLSYITGRIHYRMVTAEVGYALQETFAGTRELIKGCQEVIHVLFNASTKANLIHRDISSTNIILVADEKNGFGSRVAYVIDWEFAVAIDRLGQDMHRDWWRTGTVAFMCMNALPTGKSLGPPRPYRHFFGHDVESLIYVAVYCGLYRLPWKNYSEVGHQFYLSDVFDFDHSRGGKKVLVTEFEVTDWMSVFPESEFREWLIAALKLIPMWHPTPVSLPSPEAILAEFSTTVEVDPATLDELDAVPRKMPIPGLPIEATNSATRSLPSTANSPDRSRNRPVELSPSEGAPKRGRILRGRSQVGGSTSATVGGNTGRRERGQVPGSSTFNAVGVRTRARKRPSNESDEMGDETDVKHRNKRKK